MFWENIPLGKGISADKNLKCERKRKKRETMKGKLMVKRDMKASGGKLHTGTG
jgi:hypothetical protein